MASIRLEDLTPFGRAALELDGQFEELARIGGQIEGVDLESDKGLDDGIRLLNKVAKYSESLASTMQEFSQRLQEARGKAENGMKAVAERAQVIKERKLRQDELERRLEGLREELKTLGAGLAGSGAAGHGALSGEDRKRIAAELERLQQPMDRFIEAAQALKTEAAASRFKRLERQADAIIDSLQASRRKIAQAIEPK